MAAAKKPKTPPKPAQRDALSAETTSIIAIAASALTLICLFAAGETGFFGGFLNGLLKGLFGLGAYCAPVAVVCVCVFTLIRGRKLSRRKTAMWLGLFAALLAFAHITGGQYEPASDGTAYLQTRYLGGAAANGGLFGALLGDGLVKLLGRVGSYILLVTAAVVLLILITNRSLFAAVGRGARAVRERYMEDDEPTEPPAPEPVQITAQKTKPPKTAMLTLPANPQPPEDPPLRLIPTTTRGAKPQSTPHHKHHGRMLTLTVDEDPRRGELRSPDTCLPPPPDGTSGEPIDEPLDDGSGYMPAEPPKAPEPIAPTNDAPPWDDAPSEINVRGTGVEGYRPAVVDADGEVVTDMPLEKPAPLEHLEYVYPPIELLKENPYVPSLSSKAEILENSRKLEETLKSFGVEAKVVEVCKGPTVTRYEVAPGVGVKVSRISGLADDLALNLAAVGIRIEAPVPGKSVVGIEIPNKETQSVFLREVIGDEAFWAYPSKLSFAIGKDIAGNTVIADIAKMPHLLIAGATGAGKSVCINTLIASIVYKAAPDEVKLLMIDPKVVELSVYNNIPHLLIPVVTDPKKASGALAWAVREMETRYNLFADSFVRDLKGYNAERIDTGEPPLPQIVIIIDELADLMMTCGKEVEESICRLAQKARAAGLHLIIATQRPSVDVITGLIKANIPSRLAFAVTSGTDSRTILDMVGAEKLLGKGDMLFSPVGLSKPQRIQGSFISDKEVENLVHFIKRDTPPEFDQAMIDRITTPPDSDDYTPDGEDDLAEDAIAFIVSREKASVSMLQRKFRIGYNRAARLMEELEDRGVVGPEDGSKPRKVLMTQYQWREYKERRENIEY